MAWTTSADFTSHFWDGAGGALVGPVLGVAGSLLVAWLVFRWSSKSSQRQLYQRLHAQADQAAALLEDQKATNRELVALTADHERSLAVQLASAAAMKAITLAIFGLVDSLNALQREREISSRQQVRIVIMQTFGRLLLAERPSITDAEIRSRVENLYQSYRAFVEWIEGCETAALNAGRAAGRLILPLTGEERSATSLMLKVAGYTSQSISNYRMGETIGEPVQALTPADFGPEPTL